MATKIRKSTSSSQRGAAAHLLITTTMGGWICLCFRVLVFEGLPKAPRIDYTKTTGTAHLRTSRIKLVCTRSGGPAASASETTTTTVLTIYSAQRTGRISSTVTTATERSLMSQKWQDFGATK